MTRTLSVEDVTARERSGHHPKYRTKFIPPTPLRKSAIRSSIHLLYLLRLILILSPPPPPTHLLLGRRHHHLLFLPHPLHRRHLALLTIQALNIRTAFLFCRASYFF